ncbi:hypothetical protein CERSUDRAFT_104492 [Gelatoporia subvermispora B]|uniref:Cytochrome P450 n=1 Tax=Ceriporiopsis subvermispora (strain B) TaxID=914234 RepID=M2QQB9_CERS8|nr:hypothetical protein CERSUDRAFT_104492 [Gelatoporia subvermispora B]
MSLSATAVLPLVGAFIAICAYMKLRARSYRNRHLPPGPSRLPIVGNVLDIPAEEQWKTYTRWAQLYAPPHSEMLPMVGFDWSFGTMRYGQSWRRHRRMFHQFFHQNAVKIYQSNLVRIAPQLLKRLYQEPKGVAQHISHVVGVQILSVTYGIEPTASDDKYVGVLERAMYGINQAFHPGSFLVDYLPFLKYLPAWAPGAEFKKKAARWKVDSLAMRHVPWENVVTYMEEEQIAKNVAGVAYAGMTSSTISTLQFFFLAMVQFPEVQRRAQAELDKVVGSHRLPDFSDRASLPYVNALCKECLRWKPVVPLGLAHQSLEDDTYNGYMIPGGTILFQNTWAILQDPEEYPEPEQFKPERYLKDGKMNPDVMDPALVAFGSGRRICPGRYLSDISLFINIASVLHSFKISPAVDLMGQPLRCEPKMITGLILHPEPFDCTIMPRSDLVETLFLGRDEE